MGRRIRTKSVVVFLIVVMSLTVFPNSVFASDGWKQDKNGWWYAVGDSYYKNQWAKIGSNWYYFNQQGYMESNCYRDGYWLSSSGAWNQDYSHGTWKKNSTGWWYEDSGWYPVNQWLWIDGKCYYFDNYGYMEFDCYRDGCWLSKSGAWDTNYSHGQWIYDSVGRKFEDNGWIPKNCILKIDGYYYYFDDNCVGGYIGTTPVKMPLDATAYSYEIIPLVEPFNQYFYIKTDNPDPDSFRFYDKSSKYYDSENGSLPLVTVDKQIYEDVVYKDASKYRVNGGYIACSNSSNIDGGELVMQQKEITGVGYYGLEYDYCDTSVKVKTKALVNSVDYLIQTYGDSSKSYFDNLYGIQSGFDSICLYSGVWVLGDPMTSQFTKTVDGEEVTCDRYYGLYTSPHADQSFYIGSPYYRTDSKPMLIGRLYPYRYDSLGFPSMMATIAQKLDPSATCERDSYSHYTIHITCNGETHAFGGAGNGGGQGIFKENIKYYYKFDGSKSDAYNRCDFDTLREDNCYYGSLKIESDLDKDGLTFADVGKTVGKDGAYIRLILVTSVFGGSSIGYSFVYDSGYSYFGYMSNAWYDGRYFNNWEYFYPGVSFEETIETVHPSLVFKDYKISVPNSSKYTCNGSPLSDCGYSASTGRWNGFKSFYYDEESDSWICSLMNSIYYFDYDQWKYVYLKDDPTYGKAFVEACTITRAEALKMNLDKNTNDDPTEYYIYDETEEPGTYYKEK